MNTLLDLESWYLSQCDGDWEHGFGIKIETLDNPGWHLNIRLEGTDLESVSFIDHSYGTGSNPKTHDHEWLVCRIEDMQFKAYGGPHKLQEMIGVFLEWKDRAAEQTAPATL